MILQDRDRKILSALLRYGVLSTEQISGLFFKNVAHTTVMKRLRKLEGVGVIIRLRGLPNAMSAWGLTTGGASIIDVDEPPRYSNQNVILHEVTLSGLRICLEQMGLGADWTSETDIRRQFQYSRTHNQGLEQIIPDGVFTVKRENTEVIAVELELTPKSHARYRKILSQYALKNSIKWIWYVVGKEAIVTTVISQWTRIRKLKDSPTIIYSLLDDVIAKGTQSQIYFLNGEKRTLKEFFNIKPLLSEFIKNAESTTQRVSNFIENPLSNEEGKVFDRNQKLNSASIALLSEPSAVDPSPSTMERDRRLQA